ncbi:dienelactone hydrolase family protein [Asticcacaulis taihuensis]|uniref:dienelactone hydrolase family protein n=1 Tax=Asticcacaulis taihuensis TaxID=260084 RepID=UPI0026EBD634|nr:alpha/beta fold hydrolase [Asticcacaulis taihuensis]
MIPHTHLTEVLSTPVVVPAGDIRLAGDLTVPEGAKGLVVFAHGSGSSRRSVRNRRVAKTLNDRGLATLLIDLLTSGEEEIDQRTRQYRFDIPLLADRLVDIARWAIEQPALATLHLGYFGASTGGGAALIAAARQPDRIGAVVSRGGRPDLAAAFLDKVRAPVLLIVGGNDPQVLELNEQALRGLNARSKLSVVPGATHLFEEPGSLESVADQAADWFKRYLG